MGYLALYRKYRPINFSDIIGQDHIINVLKNQIKKEEVSHAYLFCGSRGTGKTSTAKVFAKTINCLNSVSGEPCGECEACKSFNSSIDILEIDAASNNRVDEIRELRENIKFAPLNSKFKVYIIDEVHMLTDSAFNALLKTLEEPPAHAIFILATTEIQKLPATILSRCIKFNFRLIETQVLEKFIKSIFDRESITYDALSAHIIASAGEGSVRDTLTIADMCASFCDGKINSKDVSSILAVVSTEEIIKIASGIIYSNHEDVFEVYNNVCSQGKGATTIAKELLKMFKNIFIAKNASGANKILGLPNEIFQEIEKVSKQISNEKLTNIIELLLQYEDGVKTALMGADLLFEVALVRLLSVCTKEYP